MFSLQTIFGKGDKFYGLLEASAAAARESTHALAELLATPAPQRSLEKFKLARQREKDLAAQISQELVNTFVTALEREDIESLSMYSTKSPRSSRNSPSAIPWHRSGWVTWISCRVPRCSSRAAKFWRKWSASCAKA